MSTTTTTKFVYATCKAIRDREDKVLKKEIGQEITVVAGDWMGMGGEKREAWSEYSPTRFRSLEDAKQIVPYLPGSMYGFKVIPGTVKYFEKTIVTTVEESEVELDA